MHLLHKFEPENKLFSLYLRSCKIPRIPVRNSAIQRLWTKFEARSCVYNDNAGSEFTAVLDDSEDDQDDISTNAVKV